MTPVSSERDKELRSRMRSLKIYEKDMEETFIRSSGPGGQNVNKVSTCVQIYHRPTKITIKCQTERTQALNRFKGRCLLIDKIQRQRKREEQRKIQLREKRKRQNRKRSKAGKERMLQDKKRRSERKKFRKRVGRNEDE